jgi:serine/threonine protein kinase/Tol biopolymer transport system component
MGEVYKARDTRLARTVAIKVLPQGLSEDPERRARFEREAKAISALSHPHICTLYDVGQQGGVDFLVMEHLEGETLAHRLLRGALPLDQVLRYGAEIAQALDKAHRSGIIHRDLKPGNVMLTKSGVKLLDFGLARLREVEGGEPSLLSSMPTEDKPLTQKGTIVGTLPYMAPEQLEDKEADARTDIWALGLVLYEMTTGRKAFAGSSQASLVGAILKEEPLSITELQPMAPPSLDRVVKTCLLKDPDERWQSAHDVVTELRWIAEGSADVVRARDQRDSRRYLGWTIAGLLALALGAVLFSRQPSREARMIRAAITVEEGTAVDAISLSPDGRHLAFTGSRSDARALLWVLPLDSDTPRGLTGTEGATYPFWSPDNRFLGFFADGSLKKVDVATGLVEALCPVSLPRGGTWNREGVIVFGPNTGTGLYRISASGGERTPVTSIDVTKQETAHRWPFFLPDGRHFLYYARSGRPENSAVFVASLDSSETRRLVETTSNAAYAPPGYLLFERDGKLVAQRFDAETLDLEGEAVVVAEDVAYDAGAWRSLFAVSEDGVLAYQTILGFTNQVAWFDREGKRLGILSSSENSYNVALSPDDHRLAVSRVSFEGGSRDIWLYDLSRPGNSRLTFGPGAEVNPIWSPDGSRVVFESDRDGVFDIYQKAATGGAEEELLLKTALTKFATDWSSDGRFLVYDSVDAKSNSDLWALPMTDERRPESFLRTEAEEREARFSPDGRWLTYSSGESGKAEVFVKTFPASGGKWQISNGGGIAPRWRRDGRELFYIGLDQKVMAVSVRPGATFEHDPPRELFESRGIDLFTYRSPYAVTGDGERFYFNIRAPEATSTPIRLVLDWTAGLKR